MMEDAIMKPHKRYPLSILVAPLATAVLVFGVGCGGDDTNSSPSATPPAPTTPPPVAPPPEDGRTYFIQETYPRLSNCAECHSQGGQANRPYLATSAETAYDAIKANANLYR